MNKYITVEEYLEQLSKYSVFDDDVEVQVTSLSDAVAKGYADRLRYNTVTKCIVGWSSHNHQ